MKDMLGTHCIYR